MLLDSSICEIGVIFNSGFVFVFLIDKEVEDEEFETEMGVRVVVVRHGGPNNFGPTFAFLDAPM